MQHRTLALDRGDLGRNRALRYHHVASDAAGARGQRQRSAMVTRGMGDHAARGLLRVQRPHRVARAPELERAHPLQMLGLERQLRAGQLIQHTRLQHGGHQRMRRDPRRGGQHVAEVRKMSGHARRLTQQAGRAGWGQDRCHGQPLARWS